MWHMDNDLLDVDFEEMTCDKAKPSRYIHEEGQDPLESLQVDLGNSNSQTESHWGGGNLFDVGKVRDLAEEELVEINLKEFGKKLRIDPGAEARNEGAQRDLKTGMGMVNLGLFEEMKEDDEYGATRGLVGEQDEYNSTSYSMKSRQWK